MNKIIDSLVKDIHNTVGNALLTINPTKQRLNKADEKLKSLRMNLISERDNIITELSKRKISFTEKLDKIDTKIAKVNKEIKSLDKRMLKLGFVDNKLHDLSDYCAGMKETFKDLQNKYANIDSMPHAKVRQNDLNTLKSYARQVKNELAKLNDSFTKSQRKDEGTQEKIDKLEKTLNGVELLIKQGSLKIQLDILEIGVRTPQIEKEIKRINDEMAMLSEGIQTSEMAFTREEVLAGAKGEIMTKFDVNEKAAADVCERLISSHHLSKVRGAEFAVKMREAVEGISAFGSVPQVYADESGFKRGEDAKNFAKLLYTDIGLGHKVVSANLIKALLVERDQNLLNEIAREFENIGSKLVEEMNKKNPPSQAEQMLTQMLVGNMLAIFTFLNAQDGDKFQVPQLIDGKWQMVTYDVEQLQLTPNELGEPMFAYGLRSFTNREAAPLLLFMGTPPPTVSGVKLAEWVDLAPDYAVGEIAFEHADDRLVQWMKKANQFAKQKVECYGQSLGGSLSLICAAKHPDLVGKVYAYEPPAPTQDILDEYNQNVKDMAQDKKPKVNVFMQKNDLVPYVGVGWDKDWDVFKVIPKKKNPSVYLSHIQGFSGQKEVLVRKVDVDVDRASKLRRTMNRVADTLRGPIFSWKSAALKAPIMLKGHTVRSLASKIQELGLKDFFSTIFRVPKKKNRVPFIKAMVADALRWQP